MEAESLSESECEVEEEDSDNGDGSAGIKRPLHVRVGCTLRSASKLGSGGFHTPQLMKWRQACGDLHLLGVAF